MELISNISPNSSSEEILNIFKSSTPILFGQNISIGLTWFEAFLKYTTPLQIREFAKICIEIERQLKEEYQNFRINPDPKYFWTFTNFFPINETKVVILGNDPHIKLEQKGLAFSTENEISFSLEQIYEELEDDIPGFVRPNHGNLSGWARQKVLLLNCYLTVRFGNGSYGSHRYIEWPKLTECFIRWISDYTENVIFILFGLEALDMKKLIDQDKHYVEDLYHPSHYRGIGQRKHISGSSVFSRTNQHLEDNGKLPIDWNLPMY